MRIDVKPNSRNEQPLCHLITTIIIIIVIVMHISANRIADSLMHAVEYVAEISGKPLHGDAVEWILYA